MICMKRPYSLWQPTIGILGLDHCLEPCQAMFSCLVWTPIGTKNPEQKVFITKGFLGMIDSKNVELWLTINLKRGTLFSKSVLFSGEANSSNLRSLVGNIYKAGFMSIPSPAGCYVISKLCLQLWFYFGGWDRISAFFFQNKLRYGFQSINL